MLICNIMLDSDDVTRAEVSEWLRRWTRNPLVIGRAGSNPALSAFLAQLTK